MQIRAVVFDMDGVLIDAKEWHYEALNRALALVGYAIPRFDHLSTYDGLPTRRKLEMLTLERGLPRGLHSFLNGLKQQYTMELVHARCQPTFQHEYALMRLQTDGLLLGVASNSVKASVDVMMERAGLERYLTVVLSNEDVSASKPSPQIYEEAMRRLATTPGETLVIEDHEHGVRSAESAGTHVLVVRSPADVTYERIRERIRALERQGATA